MTRTAYAFALAATCLTMAAPAQGANAYVKFTNDTGGELRVDIYHSEADPTDFGASKVQKGNYIAAGESHRFQFSSSDDNCDNKSRYFVVFPAANSVRGASVGYGFFKFNGKKVRTSDQFSRKVCTLKLEQMTPTVQNPGYSFNWSDDDLNDNSTVVTVGKP